MILLPGLILSVSWILFLQLAPYVSGEVNILYGNFVEDVPSDAEKTYVIDQVELYLLNGRRLGTILAGPNAHLRVTGTNIQVTLPIDGECWGYDFLCKYKGTCMPPRDKITCSCTQDYRRGLCPLSTKTWLKGLWITAAILGSIFLLASLAAMIVYCVKGSDNTAKEQGSSQTGTSGKSSRSVFSPDPKERAFNQATAPVPYSKMPENGYDNPVDTASELGKPDVEDQTLPKKVPQNMMPTSIPAEPLQDKAKPVFYTPTSGGQPVSGGPAIRHIEPEPTLPPEIQQVPLARLSTDRYVAQDPPYITKAFVNQDFRGYQPGNPTYRTFHEGINRP